MRKIIPVILANNIEEFQDKLEALASFSDALQIDIADGEFVESKTINLEKVKKLLGGKEYEAHLMVKRPLEYLEECRRLGFKRIIFHMEVGFDVENIIQKIKDGGFEVFLALNPETSIASVDMYVDKIDGVLLLSVEPGFSGQKLISSVLDKAKKLREKYPELIIEIDGGVGKGNIGKVFKSGVNIAVIGSGILKAKEPKKEWETLKQISNF